MASGYVSLFPGSIQQKLHITSSSFVYVDLSYPILSHHPAPHTHHPPRTTANNHQLESHYRPDHSRSRLRSGMVPQPEGREPNVSDFNPSRHPSTPSELTPGEQCLAQHIDSLVRFVLLDVGYVFLSSIPGSDSIQRLFCFLFVCIADALSSYRLPGSVAPPHRTQES